MAYLLVRYTPRLSKILDFINQILCVLTLQNTYASNGHTMNTNKNKTIVPDGNPTFHGTELRSQ